MRVLIMITPVIKLTSKEKFYGTTNKMLPLNQKKEAKHPYIEKN